MPKRIQILLLHIFIITICDRSSFSAQQDHPVTQLTPKAGYSAMQKEFGSSLPAILSLLKLNISSPNVKDTLIYNSEVLQSDSGRVTIRHFFSYEQASRPRTYRTFYSKFGLGQYEPSVAHLAHSFSLGPEVKMLSYPRRFPDQLEDIDGQQLALFAVEAAGKPFTNIHIPKNYQTFETSVAQIGRALRELHSIETLHGSLSVESNQSHGYDSIGRHIFIAQAYSISKLPTVLFIDYGDAKHRPSHTEMADETYHLANGIHQYIRNIPSADNKVRELSIDEIHAILRREPMRKGIKQR